MEAHLHLQFRVGINDRFRRTEESVKDGWLIRDGKSGGSEVFGLAFPYQFHKFFLCLRL